MRALMLVISIASLGCGLWFSWDHFQGDLSRDHLFTLFGVCSLIWFVCATAWAYMRPGTD